MPSVRKRTNIYNLYKNVQIKRPFVRKDYFNLQTYSKGYISRDQLYENMQRVTGLFENTNIMYENVQTLKDLPWHTNKHKSRSRS